MGQRTAVVEVKVRDHDRVDHARERASVWRQLREVGKAPRVLVADVHPAVEHDALIAERDHHAGAPHVVTGTEHQDLHVAAAAAAVAAAAVAAVVVAVVVGGGGSGGGTARRPRAACWQRERGVGSSKGLQHFAFPFVQNTNHNLVHLPLHVHGCHHVNDID